MVFYDDGVFCCFDDGLLLLFYFVVVLAPASAAQLLLFSFSFHDSNSHVFVGMRRRFD